MIRTDKKDFAIFVNACEEMLNKLGMADWEVNYQHVLMPPDTWASCEPQMEERRIMMRLNTNIDSDIKADLVRVAKHEALEGLLGGLTNLARERSFTEQAWCSERHSVINKLLKCL